MGLGGGVCPRTTIGVGGRVGCLGAVAVISTALTGGVADRTTGGVAERTTDLLTTLRTADVQCAEGLHLFRQHVDLSQGASDMRCALKLLYEGPIATMLPTLQV